MAQFQIQQAEPPDREPYLLLKEGVSLEDGGSACCAFSLGPSALPWSTATACIFLWNKMMLKHPLGRWAPGISELELNDWLREHLVQRNGSGLGG